jgi:RNA polymerase sigma factor (sigma-70 family)
VPGHLVLVTGMTDTQLAPTGEDTAGDAVDPVLAGLADDLDAGFVGLVRGYERLVYSVAIRLSDQPFDAEDLAAEAFLRAYRALRGYDTERILALRPRTWLLTILLNTWRNARRDGSRRPRQVPMTEAADPPVGGPGVEELAERNESLRELGTMVRRLPTTQRVSVVLRHVVGLPIAEVAAVLGCPVGTAKSHVSRGLSRLRAIYAPTAELAPALAARRRPW